MSQQGLVRLYFSGDTHLSSLKNGRMQWTDTALPGKHSKEGAMQKVQSTCLPMKLIDTLGGGLVLCRTAWCVAQSASQLRAMVVKAYISSIQIALPSACTNMLSDVCADRQV